MEVLTLIRFSKSEKGIFSHLLDSDKNIIAVTGEHAYPDGKGGFQPKIPNGTFRCVRGMHRLHPESEAFETFEITGVEGHTGLLFHCGNFPQIDSSGCVLTGTALDGNMITESRKAFAKFMDLQDGIDACDLVVC